MAIFKGSGVAIVTPMDKAGGINYDAFGRLIDFQLDSGTDAIIACGTTGEASTLTDDEQLEAIRYAVDRVKKRVPVIAGAGSNYTEHGKELCVGSQRAGADACLLVTPYYNKTTQHGLVAHFTQLAASVDIPVIVYSVPSRTGLNISAETAYALSKVDNIVGIKEASGDIVQIAEIARLCGGRFDIYSGNDELIVPVMSLGGAGVISVIANIAPRQTHELVMRFLDGDIAGSRALQLEMLPLIRELFREVSPGPVKAALNLMGFEAGTLRMPLMEMEASNLKLLKGEMRKYGLID